MKSTIGMGALALTMLAGAAQADLAGTFGFTDMGANWNSGSGVLTVGAEENGTLSSSGDLTSYAEGGPLTALFNSGFADGMTSADSQFTMELSNITGMSADAEGTFVVTDINGDTLSGSYVGTWTNQFGFGFFDGEITLASYNADTEAGNGMFEGNAGQAYAVPAGVMNGGLSMLLQMPEWFDSSTGDFEARTTQLDGILVNTVPTPGSMALLGLGGLMTARRRR